MPRVKRTPEEVGQDFMMAVVLRQTNRLKVVYKLTDDEIEQLYTVQNAKWASSKLVTGIKQSASKTKDKLELTEKPAVTPSPQGVFKMKACI